MSIKSASVLFLSLLILPSCSVSISNDDLTPSTLIKDQTLQGKFSASKPFTLKKSLYKQQELFGEAGYMITLYDTEIACGASASQSIDFFVKKLDVGTYTGKGPFFHDIPNNSHTSFIGCDIIITNVTGTTVEGKVKGGDVNDNQYIEGKFTATICK